MTPTEIKNIEKLRSAGNGYKKIADALGMSPDAVKSYCRRHPIEQVIDPLKTCPQCGSELNQTSGHRQKKFCSTKCRMAWWKSHPEELNKQAFYESDCTRCGKHFTVYGNNNRKYCSRSCAVAARKEVPRHE